MIWCNAGENTTCLHSRLRPPKLRIKPLEGNVTVCELDGERCLVRGFQESASELAVHFERGANHCMRLGVAEREVRLHAGRRGKKRNGRDASSARDDRTGLRTVDGQVRRNCTW